MSEPNLEPTPEVSLDPTPAPQGQTRPTPKLQAPKKKRKWLRRLIVLAVVAAVLALAVFLMRRNAGQTVSSAFIPTLATRQDLAVTVTGSGTVKPNDVARVTALVRGEVLTAPFEEGQVVEKGQVLYTLDTEAAEKTIRNAQSSLTRSEISYEQSQLSLNNLLKAQEDNKKNTSIKAPAAGTVTKLYIKEGDSVTMGSPIADILDRDVMELKAPFHSVAAETFSVGDAAVVTVTGTDQPLSGTVSDISPAKQVTNVGAVVQTVTIRVSNPGALDTGSTAVAQVGDAASAALGAFSYAASKQLTAPTSGKVERLYLQEGDRVTAQQVVGSFEPADTQSQIDNARLSLRSAQLGLDDAREALRSAQETLEDYTVTAPISGTVVEKNADVGDTPDATGYMVLLYDLSRLTFQMNVSELDISRIQVGQQVTFTADALDGQTFHGVVDKVSINGATMSGTTSYPVTVLVEGGEGLYPGMNVSATILVEDLGNVLTLPVDAIQRGDLVYVAGPGALNDNGELVDASKLVERKLTLGRNDSANIEIVDGLSEGDTVFFPNPASSFMQLMSQMAGR